MIKEIEVGGVKHGIALADDMVGQGLVKEENGAISVDVNGLVLLTEENLLAGDTLTKDPESGNIEIITGAAVIESNTPFVPFAKGEGKKLGVALDDGFMNESGALGLKLGTETNEANFVPLCIGLCSGLHGTGRYFGIALGSGFKRNRYNELELDGGNTPESLMVGASLKYENGTLDVRFSSNSALYVAQDGVSIKIGTEFDILGTVNELRIRLGTEVNEKTRYGFGLCVDRYDGLALSLAPGANPLRVNEKGELYIDMQNLKELLK